MRRLTELEILRAEVELLRRQLKTVEDCAAYDRRMYEEDLKRIIEGYRDDWRNSPGRAR